MSITRVIDMPRTSKIGVSGFWQNALAVKSTWQGAQETAI